MAKTTGHGAYYTAQNLTSGLFKSSDDLLHRDAKAYESGATMTETQYFGISVPKYNIHGLAYLWYLPNLGVVSGGIWVFQGFKREFLASEIFDWRNHMHDKLLENDLHDYTLDMGMRVRIIEAGSKFHLEYHDTQRNNHIDIEYSAVMPPYMFASNKHFEQTMTSKGELVLRGKRFEVDAYTVRDRSWGQLRTQGLEALPPMTWMSAVFSDEFSFCCSGFDDPESADWKGNFSLPGKSALSGGFIRKNGETRDLVGLRKRTVRNPETLLPERIEMELTDSRNTKYQINGTIVAGSQFSQWYNMTVALCLARWECEGMIGYGDAQDVKWPDYIYWKKNLQELIGE